MHTESTNFITHVDQIKYHQPVTAYYIADGKMLEDDSQAEDKSYAKQVTYSNGGSVFFVKYGRAGGEAGHIADPWSPWAPVMPSTTAQRTMGHNEFEWKRVTKSVFDKYYHFLKTRNHIYLRMAEREDKNGL